MQTNRNWIQSWRLIILLLWTLPAAVQAQLTFVTNYGNIYNPYPSSIIITGWNLCETRL